MKCPHCQKQHHYYETYCPETGKTIDDALVRKYTYDTLEFCVSCGEPNKGNYIHCTACGTDLAKVSQKKRNIAALIDQDGPVIANFKNSDVLQKGKKSLKEASAEHSSYIKNTPLILLPIVISIVFMIAIAAFVVKSIKDNLMEITESLDMEYLYILDADILGAYLEDYMGFHINIPDFPLFTTLIALLHNSNYSIMIKTIEGSSSDVLSIDQSNLFLGLMLIPVIALIIGAVVYGLMAKKYNWHFWKGIMYSTAAYTLFVTVSTFIARYKADVKGMDEYEDYLKIEIEVLPSILDSFLTALIMSAVIFTFVGYIAFAGKSIFAKLDTEWKVFKYAMYSVAATLFALFIHFISAIIAIKRDVNEVSDEILGELFSYNVPELAYYVAAAYVAVANWYMTVFGKLKLVMLESYYRENESLEISWFFKDSLYEEDINELIEATTFINPIIFLVIVVAIIGAIGFLLTKIQLLHVKDVAIIAGIFTLVQMILLYFGNVSIDYVEDEDTITIFVGYEYVRQLFIFYIISFAAIFGGSFVKTKLNGRV